MRLWHQSLIPYLDNKRLLGQHRECCALRGKGWGKKHSTVDYVFNYTPSHLFVYHRLVIAEMVKRDYHQHNPEWYNRTYRGRHMKRWLLTEVGTFCGRIAHDSNGNIFMPPVYKEHNDKYLKECLLNLKSKGAELVNGKTIEEMLISLELKDVK